MLLRSGLPEEEIDCTLVYLSLKSFIDPPVTNLPLLAAFPLPFTRRHPRHYEAFPYEALSYVWGDPEVTELIRINESDYAALSGIAGFPHGAQRMLRLQSCLLLFQSHC